ncbi:energy-coupled thiamine transporter ThiT [Alkalibacterium olivapovliticus]|uniref:Thiamine transporter n=1 Tax=Alkalibacterium olivapovliticus TaxID=99907 RepID=A0A2T0WAX7_9LACT|nr:energy-coupled thiamine transporter ThiT [Alkalibacterium olivapovliticus]PRY83859.1 thiamine transporter [Alkalibacterium olivapovliticus]
MRNRKLRIYLEGTLFAALAMVLSFIPSGIGSSYSVSLGMIPLTFFAIRRGFGPGIFAGFLWGALHFVTGSVYMLNVYQVIIEYTITYASIGLAGLYSGAIVQEIQSSKSSRVNMHITLAVFAGALGRYFWHFIAGWIFWGDYALWGLSAMSFSLIMNGLSMISTAFVTVMVLLMVYSRSPLVFIPKSK